MKGTRTKITDRDREQLARWLRHAATSGEGMPSVRIICARFGCGTATARRMLEEQRDAGVITLKPGSGGQRPAAQIVRQHDVRG